MRSEEGAKLYELPLLFEAVAAINRTTFGRMKWYFTWFPARSTYSIKHFALRAPGIFAGVAARFTSLGFICKTLLLIKILLACSENEFLTAVFADQCLVLMIQLAFLALIKYA